MNLFFRTLTLLPLSCAFTGLRKWKYATRGVEGTGATKTVMGFGGSTVEAACFLLADSLVGNNPLATKHRQLGEAVINTYLTLKLSPPAGEGFSLYKKMTD